MRRELEMVVIEEDAAAASVWRDAFSDVPTASVVEKGRLDALQSINADAEVMGGIFAHERFGGNPEVGQSQVLYTLRQHGAPEIVVTTPPFQSSSTWKDLKESRVSASKVALSIINGKPIDEIGMAYESFRAVFAAIDRLNSESVAEIRTVAFVPGLCGVVGDVQSQSRAVKEAYLEYLRRGSAASDG